MRLDELVGIKKYRSRSVHDVLADFQRVGGQVLGVGKYGQVIWHPRWNYVFKTFPKDDQYLRFIRFAKRHQEVVAFPRVLGGPWKIVPFYRRPLDDPYLYVVKLERLYPIRDPDLRRNVAALVGDTYRYIDQDQSPRADAEVAAYRAAKREYETATDRAAKRAASEKMDKSGGEYLSKARVIWERYPGIKELAAAYNMVMKAGLDGAEDLHNENFMQREDGTLVLIDPLWEGESFWQMHNRVMQAELPPVDDEPEEPNEYNSLMGGRLRPRKRPKPRRAPLPPLDDADIPF